MSETHNPRRPAEETRGCRPTRALAGLVLLAMTLGGPRARADKGPRQAEATRAVEEARARATALHDQSRSATRGGAALFAQALTADLDEEEKDRRLLATLDKARLAQAETVPGGGRFASERAVPLFHQAFRAYGLPAGEVKPAEAAERIRKRPAAVRAAILDALDEWDELASDRRLGIAEPHRAWLRAVLEAAGPDNAWSQKVRDARREADPARKVALEALARSADVRTLTARSLTRLAAQLRPPQAAALLRRAWQQHPADFWVNRDLGVALTRLAPPEWDEAARFLTAAVALRPGTPGAYLDLGVALTRKGQIDEAIVCFRKAIELDPTLARAHDALGRALLARGQVEDAIASWRRAIALDPRFAVAHTNLGGALRAKGRVDEAIACFRRAIDLDPRQPAAHANLGTALKDKGKLDEANACYRRAIDLDPKDATSYSLLGAVLARKGQVGEAIACLRMAIALHSKHLEGGQPADRAAVRRAVLHWQKDRDLAGIRDAALLAKLPAEERAACERLWADVARLLRKAEAPAK